MIVEKNPIALPSRICRYAISEKVWRCKFTCKWYLADTAQRAATLKHQGLACHWQGTSQQSNTLNVTLKLSFAMVSGELAGWLAEVPVMWCRDTNAMHFDKLPRASARVNCSKLHPGLYSTLHPELTIWNLHLCVPSSSAGMAFGYLQWGGCDEAHHVWIEGLKLFEWNTGCGKEENHSAGLLLSGRTRSGKVCRATRWCHCFILAKWKARHFNPLSPGALKAVMLIMDGSLSRSTSLGVF